MEKDSPAFEPTLTFEETRVLGCLLEKERTTPEYYPLTQNSLASACNQKSSRDPVTSFDDDVVGHALDGLREKGLVMRVAVAGSRVPKFKHTVADVLHDLDDGTTAVLCVLLLRGQQTTGELKSRTERMHHFEELTHAQTAVDALIEQGLAREVPAGGGRRVTTFVQLLGAMADGPAVEGPADTAPALQAVTPSPSSVPDTQLAGEVERLREELRKLRADFEDFRMKFEG
ncbi:MAG: YceH family protein [Verrucomicrobiota bacterium]